MSEGTVGKMVTGSKYFVFTVDDSSFVTSDLGDSIDGVTAVEMLTVDDISADEVVVVVMLLGVVIKVVDTAWVAVVVVGIVVEMVVVVVDVNSVVCEIVSRCDVWHKKQMG